MSFSQHRPAAVAIVLAAIAALSIVTGAFAADPPPPPPRYDRIAQTALRYEGTRQGQCWPFAQRAVMEATGKKVGFDYRLGFFEAGAVEVNIRDARSGDIIQIARDTDTSPDADYPGLHTAIIMASNGDGSFTTIASNDNWDGMVRRRENYNPAKQAASYGDPRLGFHIYRIPYDGQSLPPVPPAAPRTVANGAGVIVVFRNGDSAVVKADGDCLNVRSTPGGPIVKCIKDGTKVVVASEAISSTGRTWVQVSADGTAGWVATEFLAPVAAATAPATSGGGITPVVAPSNPASQAAAPPNPALQPASAASGPATQQRPPNGVFRAVVPLISN
jgi:uncharacterized protein YraI